MATKKEKEKEKIDVKIGFAFGKENYILLIIGFAIIILGFILMIGGGSDDPKVFNPDIFSFRRITLAPVIVLFGFVFEIFAIMKKPKSTAK
jgi:membrane-bound ClpP family serine protease